VVCTLRQSPNFPLDDLAFVVTYFLRTSTATASGAFFAVRPQSSAAACLH
jgi:hypothetical protein